MYISFTSLPDGQPSSNQSFRNPSIEQYLVAGEQSHRSQLSFENSLNFFIELTLSPTTTQTKESSVLRCVEYHAIRRVRFDLMCGISFTHR
jgi:hypothetical protein